MFKLSYFLLFLTWSWCEASIQIALPLIEGYDLIGSRSISINPEVKAYNVFYFLSSHCPCTKSHIKHLNQLKKDFPEYQFIGIHSNKFTPRAEAEQFTKDHQFDFPIIEDKELKYANILKANKTPHVFVIDKKGTLVYQGGATNRSHADDATKFYLKDVLNDLKENKKPRYTESRTVGCYIAR